MSQTPLSCIINANETGTYQGIPDTVRTLDDTQQLWDMAATSCHGSFPDSPWPSKASPPPPTAWPVSKPFRSASDPPGSSAYFSFSLTDSHMTLYVPNTFLYLILSIPPVYTLISNLLPWLWLRIPNFRTLSLTAVKLLTWWELLSLISEDYHCVRYVSLLSLFPCTCYRTEDYHCVNVSHLFGSPLS